MVEREVVKKSLNKLFIRIFNSVIEDPLVEVYNGAITIMLTDILSAAIAEKKVVDDKIELGRDSEDISNLIEGYNKLKNKGYI